MSGGEGPAVDRRALAAALPLLALSVTLGLLAAIHETFPGDETVSAWARTLGPGFAPVAHVFNNYQLHIGIPLYFIGLGLLLWRRDFEAAAMAFAVGLARPVLQVGKVVLGRPRPEGDFPILDIVTDASFPSGHVMTAATFVGIWVVFAPRMVGDRHALPVQVAGVVIIVVMAVSRMWAGVHWFSDTYGAVLWVATAFAFAFAFRGWMPRPRR